jgi:serine/threonine-protein kinase HipA
MPRNPEHLDVYLHDTHIAQVSPVPRERRKVALQWDDDLQLGGITPTESFSAIPGAQVPVNAATNWLGGYTPEGNQRLAMARTRDINPEDLFALLREFGGSIAGAISLRVPDEPSGYHPRYQAITPRLVGRRLRQAVARNDLGIQDDSRSMVPGFQPKLLLACFDGQWHEPHGRAHSTHILKPRLDSRPQAIHNEFYALSLAKALGLATTEPAIRKFGDQTALVLPRFDRTVSGGEVALTHQEDLAQALSLDWFDSEAKFQDRKNPKRPDRPTARAIAEVLGSLPASGELVSRWLRQLVFRILIGDNDAHAKNFALLHETRTRLADVYDAAPNLFQEDRISYDLAMSVDGEFDWRRINSERIANEAASWGVLTDKHAQQAIDQTVAAFASTVETLKPPREATAGLREHFLRTVERLGR